MHYDFDRVIDRRDSDSAKWSCYPAHVLPLWTADMDFRVADPIVKALQQRVAHGIFGYADESAELRDVLSARLAEKYGWRVSPDEMVFLPGVILGFHRVCRMAVRPGEAVVVQPPVYPPILHAAGYNGLECAQSDLMRTESGRYEIDFASFETAITERTRVFLLCNPHNPVGRAFHAQELERVAEICLRRKVLICSDEIHCDILFGDTRHIPIASLSQEIARRTITLMAPSKTYNIPGLHCSFAIIQDPDLRRQFRRSGPPHSPQVNTLGQVAALAAYKGGDEWLQQALCYLETNRDLVSDFVAKQLPGIATHRPEATYLAWLDCRRSGIAGNPYEFFLEKARVALSPGPAFGKAGEGFVRLNFGCPRSTLLEALERMKSALSIPSRL